MADNKSENVSIGTTDASPSALADEAPAASADPADPSGAVVTASEYANGTNNCDVSGTTSSRSAATAAAAAAAPAETPGGSSRRRRTKKVAKRKRRPDGEEEDDESVEIGRSDDDADTSIIVPPAAAEGPVAAPPAEADVPQSNMTKVEWMRYRQRQRDERRRQIVADIVERRNNLSGRSSTTPSDGAADDGAPIHPGKEGQQRKKQRIGKRRSSAGGKDDGQGDGDSKGSVIDDASDNGDDDDWSDTTDKDKGQQQRLSGPEDGDDDEKDSLSEGYSSGSPTSSYARRRRRRWRQNQIQQQRRRSSSDFIMLDTTSSSNEDNDDNGRGAGESSSEYHESEDGDLSSSDDNSDQKAEGIIATRRLTRKEGRIAQDARAVFIRARSTEASDTSAGTFSMSRPVNDDTDSNQLNASFTSLAPGVGVGRRTKKVRSAKRLATVSMPRTGQAFKGPAIMLRGSAASGEKSEGSAGSQSVGSTTSVDKATHTDSAIACAKAAGDVKHLTQHVQVPQQPQPTTQLHSVRTISNVTGGTSAGMLTSVSQSQQQQTQQQQQLLQQSHIQQHPRQPWPQLPSGLPSHQQTGAGDNVAAETNKANIYGTTAGNGAPKRKRGRPRKHHHDSPGMNRTNSSIPKKLPLKDQPAPLPLPDPASQEAIVRQLQPKSVSTSLVFPTGLEETISKAASLVAAEIRSGCWVRRWADGLTIVDTASNVEMARVEKLREHALNAAAAALEQFAMEMILPSFISGGVKEGPGSDSTLDSSSEGSHRTIAGTFLALREILIMNADSYFFHVGCSDRDRSDLPCGYTHDSTHEAEERVLRARLLATGVLFASINRLDEERESVLANLTTAIGDYDAAEDTFALCLERADGRSLGILPNGKTLSQEENIAWGVSFNCTREKHPLITMKNRRDLARRLASFSRSTSDVQKAKLAASVLNDTTHRLDVPKPNACAIYFVGEDGPVHVPGSRISK